MQYIMGFFIPLFIAITGVGAGTITVPLLVLLLGIPASKAVGSGSCSRLRSGWSWFQRTRFAATSRFALRG